MNEISPQTIRFVFAEFIILSASFDLSSSMVNIAVGCVSVLVKAKVLTPGQRVDDLKFSDQVFAEIIVVICFV